MASRPRGRPKDPNRERYRRLLLKVPGELVDAVDKKKDELNSQIAVLDMNRATLIRLGMRWVASAPNKEVLARLMGKKG